MKFIFSNKKPKTLQKRSMSNFILRYFDYIIIIVFLEPTANVIDRLIKAKPLRYTHIIIMWSIRVDSG